jgi:TonB family protein
MRSIFLSCAAIALAGPAAALAAAPPIDAAAPSGAQVNGDNLRTLFRADDYPALAIKNHEEGSVEAELRVGTDGLVKACSILRSSNSAALDAATCDILTARAQFLPARDRNGKAVEDRVVTPPIVWRIEEDTAPTPTGMKQTQPGIYQCNTPAGHFLEQDIRPLQRDQELRLGFRLVEEHFSERWTVLAAVYLIGPKGKSRIAIGKAQNDRGKMYVAVSMPGDQAQDIAFHYPVTDKWMPLNVTLDFNGILTVQSGRLIKRYPWGAVSRTYLHCNSGDWEISVAPQSYLPPAAATAAPEVK